MIIKILGGIIMKDYKLSKIQEICKKNPIHCGNCELYDGDLCLIMNNLKISFLSY